MVDGDEPPDDKSKVYVSKRVGLYWVREKYSGEDDSGLVERGNNFLDDERSIDEKDEEDYGVEGGVESLVGVDKN